eukprot:NODE_46_length_27655_cov_0.671796.p9 type:complete len:361 gc:universal NODE_46_length_27655_cov_0.671796:6348-5266(-)
MYSGFYKLSVEERQKKILDDFKVSVEDITTAHLELSDQMIENCIGVQTLPLGVGLHFKIDGIDKVVPMAIEEPSVIAAASGAAKTIKSAGGFTTSTDKNIVCSQICIRSNQIYSDFDAIMQRKEEFISLANEMCPAMVRRGGGVEDMIVRMVPRSNSRHLQLKPLQGNIADGWCVIHILINSCDSMGANVSASVAEGLSPHLQKILPSSHVAVRIVSNLNTYRTTKSSFSIPISQLAFRKYTGMEVAQGILEVYSWALDDPYRSCTHNKGVMNGIISVALATGQDTRALEANVHGYSAQNDFLPLTSYKIVDDRFVGEIKIPLPVGTVGGSIQTLPSSRECLKILGNPDAQELARVIFTN